MSLLGSPSQDRAGAWPSTGTHSEGMGQLRLPGFRSNEAMIARFEERSGRPATAFDSYELFAGFRLCVIMGRLAVTLKDWGLIPADHDMGQDDAPALLSAKKLEDRGC